AGEHRSIPLTFPADYGVADLAGREAVFAVDVKEVRQRAPLVIDDELGKAVGLESLAELREEVQQRMRRDYAAAARLRLKRALLANLAERNEFPVPSGMVGLGFDAIWPGRRGAGRPAVNDATGVDAGGEPAAASGGEVAAGSTDEPAEAPGDAAVRAEYRKIAERRVRLGLLLAEVGRGNNITVSQEELNQAVIREAIRHVGHERRVLDFFRQHPEATARLRAPIFEDKVIDFTVGLASLHERRAPPQERLSLPEPEGPEPVSADVPPAEPPN